MLINTFAAEMIMKSQQSDIERQSREAWKWAEVKNKTSAIRLRNLLKMNKIQTAPPICCNCC